MSNFRTVIVNDLELNIFQIMVLKNGKKSNMTLFKYEGLSPTSLMNDLLMKGLITINCGKYYRLTEKGEGWLKAYVGIKQAS